MAQPDPNPYESPQAELSRAQRVARRVSLWIALPVTAVAMVVTFCVSCFPTAVYVWDREWFGVGYGPAEPFSLIAVVVGVFPWAVGGAAAAFVGWVLWKLMRGPKRAPRSTSESGTNV
ncbi:hypothetical protein Pla123a_22160 [Posidoniimonas polymericola]|uniref:Uncharacterized protein n=1 Tax=Posidoniimonas polymericola TaxID=2528002 RepID=A0A5C5YRN2_9BACT|nr:hypothetical protein [Posidoniimonas polymericola]TWT77555.1 hypothetical protein Pla123a_22160 [Posidoniimonas polymericola]